MIFWLLLNYFKLCMAYNKLVFYNITKITLNISTFQQYTMY